MCVINSDYIMSVKLGEMIIKNQIILSFFIHQLKSLI